MTNSPQSGATSRMTLLIDRFDAAWQGDQPPRLSEFLITISTEAARRELLCELIPIDLEYRWRKFGSRQENSHVSAADNEIAGLPRTPSLQDYSEGFPELVPLASLPSALFVQEYRVRRRWDRWSGPADFEAVYPTIFSSVRPLLVELDHEHSQEQSQLMESDPELSPTFSVARQSALLNTSARTHLPVLSPSRTIDPGVQLGEYRLLERLGKGGMGEVFKAEHRRMQRLVALKVLPPERVASPDSVQRFHREVVAIARLKHPNIVAAYDAREDQGVHYLVMEYVPGADLARLVKEQGPLSASKAVAYMLQAARGLVYTHEHGVVHRDLKPANFLLADDGTIMVLDLGLARLQFQSVGDDSPQHSLTSDGDLMGTADFMAPEQALNAHKADARSDIYSLGCTLYYLMTGQRMYAGETFMERLLAHQTQPIPSLAEAAQQHGPGIAAPELLESLNATFQKMVAKAVNDRYQTMAEVVAALEAISLAHRTESTSPASETSTSLTLPAATPPHRRRWYARSLGTALLIGLAIALFTIVGRWRPQDDTRAENDTRFAAQLDRTQDSRIDGQGPAPDAPSPAIAPFSSVQAKEYQERWAKHLGVNVDYQNSIGMKFRLIPPGEFMMGSTSEEIESLIKKAGENKIWKEIIQSQTPKHPVVLTKAIYLGMHEVTQAQYQKVVGVNPSHFAATGTGKEIVAGLDTSTHPVERVNWNDATVFCNKLAELPAEKSSGCVYRLPTEAEWEFACRAGTQTKYSTGNRDDQVVLAGWLNMNSGKRTHAVGELITNPFGLYDMHGNVCEWCNDQYAEYSSSREVDPVGPASRTYRVRRNVSWFDATVCAGAAYRGKAMATDLAAYNGFRVAMAVPTVKHSAKRTAGTGVNTTQPTAAEGGKSLPAATGHLPNAP